MIGWLRRREIPPFLPAEQIHVFFFSTSIGVWNNIQTNNCKIKKSIISEKNSVGGEGSWQTDLSPYMCNGWTYCCPVESCHLWQTWVVGFQSCWELRAWTVAAPWSDSVECSPTCHVFHSAQCPSSSCRFSDHKWRLVSEIPLRRTYSQTGAVGKNSSY